MQNRGPSMASDTPKDTKSSLKRLISYLKKSKFLISLCLIFVLISTSFSLIGPKISGQMITEIENSQFDNIVKYTIILVIIYLISMIFNYLLTILMINVGQHTTRLMRKDLFDKILDLPISFFDKNSIGDIVSRLTYDIDLVNSSLTNDVIQLLKGIIIIIGSLIMMFNISLILTFVFLITVPISIYFARYRMRLVKPLFKKRSKCYGNLNGYSEEMLSSLKTIRIYNMEENIIKTFDKYNHEATDGAFDADYEMCKLGPSVNFISNISLCLITVFGSILYLKNSVSIGDLGSFVQYSKKFQGPINEFSNIISEIQSSLAALERVISIIDYNDEYKGKLELYDINDCKGNIEFKNVKFGYDNLILFKDLNLDIKSNQKVAIVGPTGAGKTTLINLLMRFYDSLDGKIYLDNLDSYEIKLKSLRKNYSYVSQEGWIFTGSIYENVGYSNQSATKEDIINACKAAQINDYIEKLPNKYDTIISSNSNMSKGQAQLIAIARAILSEAKILILDEATSNVDTKTEKDIEQAIKNATINKTSFIIAHRLQTIVNSDLIIVVNDGKIIESGTHKELLDKKGSYYMLYSSQFK